jgi:uncharacterized protein
MTKRFRWMIPCVLVTAFVLQACTTTTTTTQTPAATAPAATPKPAAPFTLNIGTGAAGGVYAVIGAGVTDLINRKNPDIRAAAQAAAGGVENMRLVGSKQTHMGFATTDVLFAGYNGTREFAGKPFKNVRALMANYENVLHFLVPEESSIQTLKDIKGKTISVGAPGSLPRAVVDTILDKYYGLKLETDYKQQNLSTTDGLAALKNRQIDGQFIVLGLPAASVIEAMTTSKLRFVSIEPSVLDQAVADFAYWSKTSIGQTVYPNMPAATTTLGIPTVLITHEEVPDDIIYKVMKTVLEGTDELAKVHNVGKDFNLSNVTKGISTPFHPGAIKYLAEKGITVK